MKKVWLSLYILIFILISCSSADDQSNTPELSVDDATTEPLRVALVMKTLTNPFFVEMERGAREAEEEFGITLVVKTAAQETSIEQQISIVDGLVRDGVDAIVISPGDSLALIPVLKKAQEAGIIVINIDNRLDPAYSESEGLQTIPFISVNNETAAYQSARYISDQITTPTEVIILEGIGTAQNAQDRKDGAVRAFSENENINIVAMETANWKIDEGYEVTKALFAAHPDIGAVFASNDMMALGAIQYLKEAGKTDTVLVAAFDALEEAKEAIVAGGLAVTIDQLAAKQGYLGVEYAIRALNGEEIAAETFIDVLLVTKDNLQ